MTKLTTDYDQILEARDTLGTAWGIGVSGYKKNRYSSSSVSSIEQLQEPGMKFYTYAQQMGNRIFYRGYINGRRVTEKVEFSPTLFVTSKKKTDYRTLFNEYVEPMHFTDIRDAKDFAKRYEDVDGFKVYGMTNYQYQFLSNEFPGEIEYNLNDLQIESVDIEVASEDGFPDPVLANEEILLISMANKVSRRNIVFGTRSYDREAGDKFEFRLFTNEAAMLREFILFWQANCPDILTGWNVDGYDVPYLVNRINKILGEEWVRKLSPFGMVNDRTLNKMGHDVVMWDIVGVVTLDYLDLYKKFTYSSQESYALGHIGTVELGIGKHDIEGSFKDAYTNHWHDFVRYNAHDADLVLQLDDKLKFIEVVLTIAFLAKCNLKDVFGPVKTWDIFIYNYLKSKNIVIPPQGRKHGGEFEGAWVKEPVPGMYGWTMSFDFASLYPSIIRQWNMSPETLIGMQPGVNVDTFMDNNVESTEPLNATLAANGAMFKKDVYGIIPEVVKVVIDGRKIAKKEMLKLEQEYNKSKNEDLVTKIAALNGKQMAFKILANALYGALSNAGFRYYDLRIAEAITITGQASDRHVEKTLNTYMNSALKTEGVDYVIAGDTDSVYLNVDPLVRKVVPDPTDTNNVVQFLDKVGKTKFQEQLNKSIDYIYNVGNCYERIMDMKREAIASRAIWTAKKRYAMMVHNSEGVDYSPYKMKVMGMDIIKSSTPLSIRKKLKEALVVIFEKDQAALHEYVGKLYADFINMPVEYISFPRSVTDITKWTDSRTIYKPSTPIHVRGSLLYNKFNKDNKEIAQIRNGDKIKFIYLKVPNPIRENVVAFPSYGVLPESMGLHKYVDYDKMWESVFIAPLKGICTAIGWTPEKKASLEDFFG